MLIDDERRDIGSALRVALFVEAFPLLSETFVVSQCAALVKAGVEVDVFATRRDASGLAHEAVRAGGLMERARFASDTLPARVAARLRRPFRVCERLRDVGRIVNDRSPHAYDAILCHFGYNGLRAMAAVDAGRLKGPVWTIFHGYDLSQGIDVDRHPYQRLFAGGARFLPISEYWERRLRRLGCPADRITVHRVGVDCAAIPFRPRDQSAGLKILSVCRLTEKKGVEQALRALAAVRAAAPALAWEYDIVGDGPLRPPLDALVDELGLGDRVRFLGALPHAEVRERLEAANLFLLPSVTAKSGDMEGIPVALMEAMAAGLPVASTHHSGIPELVEHGVGGLLAPERDVRQLADNLLAFAGDPLLGPRLAANARGAVERRFNSATLDGRLVRMIAAARSGE